MPTRETAPVGAPCWIDLMTTDTERARAFYPELFGWTAGDSSAEFGGYFMFLKNGVPVAGAMAAPADGDVADVWGVYLASDDTQKTVDAAWSSGGQVRQQPMTVADLGVQAIISAPDGARVGVWQPISFQGLTVLGEPGAPAWFELHTRDYANALRFYREVFRMHLETQSDTPEFRYTTAKEAGTDLAGFIDASGWMPEGSPGAWLIYFAVDDVDTTIAKAVSLGATTITDAEDTPYGRLATLADPMGATFKLSGPNVSMPMAE